MRTLAIVGGKLQGMEACYLARHAGIGTYLIDIDPQAPASGMCDRFVCGDLIAEDPEVIRVLQEADLVLPAMENDAVLQKMVELRDRLGFRLAFDMDAYRISSSKRASDAMFHRIGVPAPRYYPEGDYPYFAKEDNGSGSHGAVRLDTAEQMDEYLKTASPDAIIQEYIEGPSYSVEIIGQPGSYRLYEITQIHVDESYDCNLVTIPREKLTHGQKETFKEDAIRIAEEMQLHGIMDYEVILHDGKLKMLEIDARIPSQTPAAVLHATGMNELQDLYDLFCYGAFQEPYRDIGWYSAFEHFLRTTDGMESLGEHIMTEGGIMTMERGFCESEEAETDYYYSEGSYRAVLINSAETLEELEEKRRKAEECVRNLPPRSSAD